MNVENKRYLREVEDKKRRELSDDINNLSVFGETITNAEKVIEYLEDACYIELSPPETSDEIIQWVDIKSLHSGEYGAASYKPGNIFINIRSALAENVATTLDVIVSAGSFENDHPVIGSIAMVAALLSVAGFSKINLSAEAALILVVAWKCRNEAGHRTTKYVFEAVNKELQSSGREKMTMDKYSTALTELERIRCIEINSEEIEIVEKIQIQY